LKHIRCSGGEPTVHAGLMDMVKQAEKRGVNRIALSTNGSAEWAVYEKLVGLGVNDFSISLDACCSAFGDKMAGVKGKWNRVVESIAKLSERTYVTVGVVLTDDNVSEVGKIVKFAHNLGVADIRVIPAAQYAKALSEVKIGKEVLDAHPILKYRFNNAAQGNGVRGLSCGDCKRCHLVKDDSVVAGNFHFPCVIYLREGGDPIGTVGENMRQDRIAWFESHDTFEDEICGNNCLDVCVDYNNKAEDFCRDRVCVG
jgi:molybdenum cofactor biosynthesis enzyme MoaA